MPFKDISAFTAESFPENSFIKATIAKRSSKTNKKNPNQTILSKETFSGHLLFQARLAIQ
jgi:hypothetical protein